MKRKLVLSAFTVLLMMCVCALTGCSGKKTIDFKDYVSVTFEGYSGSGKARVHVNYDALRVYVNSRDIEEDIWYEVSQFDELKNGDTVAVQMQYNALLLENAKVKAKNPVLTFVVAGLKEKEKLDLFSKVKLETNGTSPECSLTIKYDGAAQVRFVVLDELGAPLERYNGEYYPFKNGDKVTVKIDDNSLQTISEQYEIMETSREYTVKSDSKYILSADDLTGESRKALDKIAEDCLNEKIGVIKNASEKSERYKLYTAVTGKYVNELTSFEGSINKLEKEKLNSAYVGVGDIKGSWGTTVKNQKSVYFLYDAQIAYYYKDYFTDAVEDETSCVLIVRADDPRITPEGVTYSGLTFLAEKDFQSAYNKYITSSFEKLP